MSIEHILNENNKTLIDMLNEEKQFVTNAIQFPSKTKEAQLHLISWNSRNRYILYINRKSNITTRYTLQNKIHDSFILLRLDLDTKPHRNPNGEKISGNHLHLFDRGDTSGSWAFELTDPDLNILFPQFPFAEITKSETTQIEQFRLFCNLCNIQTIPNINIIPENETLDF